MQKGVQPSTSKVSLIKWPVSVDTIKTNNLDYPMARHFNKCHNGNDILLKMEGIELVE